MEDNKISPENEPGFDKIVKWFENLWYHYKFQILAGAVILFTVIISTSQLVTREEYDYCLLYAGPRNIAIQDLAYMEMAVESIADDRSGDGKVNVTIDDVVMLSPEEQKAALEAGLTVNGEFLNNTMDNFYQQILGGDAVVCLLSPYMYGIVRDADGFMPLKEVLDEVPDSAVDEWGIKLSETDFGRSFNGMDDLPADTVLCVRRISTMAKLKGEKKTRAAHEAGVALFVRMVTYTAEAE